MADGILDVIEVGRVLVDVGGGADCNHRVGLHHDDLSLLGFLEGGDDLRVQGGGGGIHQPVVVGGHVVLLVGGLVLGVKFVEDFVPALAVLDANLRLQVEGVGVGVDVGALAIVEFLVRCLLLLGGIFRDLHVGEAEGLHRHLDVVVVVIVAQFLVGYRVLSGWAVKGLEQLGLHVGDLVDQLDGILRDAVLFQIVPRLLIVGRCLLLAAEQLLLGEGDVAGVKLAADGHCLFGLVDRVLLNPVLGVLALDLLAEHILLRVLHQRCRLIVALNQVVDIDAHRHFQRILAHNPACIRRAGRHRKGQSPRRQHGRAFFSQIHC